jgi:hypothetical protein
MREESKAPAWGLLYFWPRDRQTCFRVNSSAKGVMQWVLTAMKLSTLRLDGDELSIVSGGLKGETHTVIPVSAIESTECGFKKEISYLFVAAGFLIWGIATMKFAPFLLNTLFAVALLAFYYFSKEMFISVSAGSCTEFIRFKHGLVDGESIDLERTLEAISVINSAVLAKSG